MDNLLKKLVISDFSYRTFHHNLKDISTSVFNSIHCLRLCVTLGVTEIKTALDAFIVSFMMHMAYATGRVVHCKSCSKLGLLWVIGGRVAEWLESWTRNSEVLSLSPALTASWICSW